jgi:hypothetical protein
VKGHVILLKLIRAVAPLSLVVLVASCGGQATTTSAGTNPSGGTNPATGTTGSPTTASTPAATTSVQTKTATATATATPTTSQSTSTSKSRTSTTTTATTRSSQTPTTTSGCGNDCQPTGTPAVPGSRAPVNGKCSAGYTYLPPQDRGPALCIRQDFSTTTTSSGH